MTTKTNRASLLVAMLAGAMALSGCASTLRSMTPRFDELEGKVVRVVVSDGRVGLRVPATETPGAYSRKLYHDGYSIGIALYGGDPNDTKVTEAEVVPYRWGMVEAPGLWKESSFFGGGVQGGPFPAVTADGVPLLKKGDWVDVYVPAPNTFSVRTHTFLTVVRLVCAEDDHACQKRVAAEIGVPRGQLVQPKGTFDWASVRITPHYTLDGHWLPGKALTRPSSAASE